MPTVRNENFAVVYGRLHGDEPPVSNTFRSKTSDSALPPRHGAAGMSIERKEQSLTRNLRGLVRLGRRLEDP